MNMLTLVEKILTFTSFSVVRKCVNVFCLNKERIKKKEVSEQICSEILAYYAEHSLKKKIVAEESKFMQKYYFKEQIKKFSLRKKNKKILFEYEQNLERLNKCETSEEIIEFLVKYYIDDMVADFNPGFLIFFREVARWLFRNMFLALNVTKSSEPAVNKIKKIQGKYPLFILPNHISNADHIPLCIALNKAGVFHPVIVAGANLYRGVSKKILPKVNCYKLQRKYIYGDVKWLSNPLYSMVFKKYNYYLWKHNEPFLFYIEGTRSRDGRILPPKYGFLKEILKFIEEYKAKAYLVPVSLSYTVVPEDTELVKSLKGKNISQKDIMAQNLELDKIYGSVKNASIFINIAEPIEVSHKNIPDVNLLAKNIMEDFSKNIVVTATYFLAEVILRLNKEKFSINDIKKHIAETDSKFSIEELMETGMDIFMKKKAVEKVDNESFKIVNNDLIMQYSNRIAHL